MNSATPPIVVARSGGPTAAPSSRLRASHDFQRRPLTLHLVARRLGGHDRAVLRRDGDGGVLRGRAAYPHELRAAAGQVRPDRVGLDLGDGPLLALHLVTPGVEPTCNHHRVALGQRRSHSVGQLAPTRHADEQPVAVDPLSGQLVEPALVARYPEVHHPHALAGAPRLHIADHVADDGDLCLVHSHLALCWLPTGRPPANSQLPEWSGAQPPSCPQLWITEAEASNRASRSHTAEELSGWPGIMARRRTHGRHGAPDCARDKKGKASLQTKSLKRGLPKG